MHKLNHILRLEDSEKYNEAYLAYQTLIIRGIVDFDAWKHYFFFLYTMVESPNEKFSMAIDLHQKFADELAHGLEKFRENTEFNFIVGYALCFIPGNYEGFEALCRQGVEMLKKAHASVPENPMYTIAYLGAIIQPSEELKKQYTKACIASKEIVQETFSGKGLLNNYFKVALSRF